jgi:hypothetical protein
MSYKPRIYVYAPFKSDLADRVAVKEAVLDMLRAVKEWLERVKGRHDDFFGYFR